MGLGLGNGIWWSTTEGVESPGFIISEHFSFNLATEAGDFMIIETPE